MIFIDKDTMINEKMIMIVTNKSTPGIIIYSPDEDIISNINFGSCKLFKGFLEYAPKCSADDTFEEYVKRCS